MDPGAAHGERAPTPALLAFSVVVAVLSISTAAILLRWSDAPSLVKAFYRLAIATGILSAVAFARPASRRALRALTPRDLALLSLVGVVLAVHFASWIESLELTTVAASVVLVTLHPIFVGVASARLYGEGLPRAGWLGVAVALLGGGVIVYGDGGRGTDPLVGDLLALVGAAAAAIYFLAGRGFRRRLPLLAYVVPVYAAAAITLLVAALWRGDPILGWPVREYAIFVALAVLPMILGHTLLNFALKYLTAPVIATTVLGEPVGSTILAAFLLAEVPELTTLVGGAIVLGGIGLVVVQDQRARRAGAPVEVEVTG